MSPLLWLFAFPAIAVTSVFAIELALGLLPRREPARSDVKAASPSIAVLMPAHDEAAGIEQTLARLRPVLPPNARVLLVADNCTDDTAARARGAGVVVVERFDTARRGKGYALAFGRDALADHPPDCVIVLDADCDAEPGALERLAAAAVAWRRPVQARYLLRPSTTAAPLVQLSNFAFLIKNMVRQHGLARLGAPALLTGTGMAFPWAVFARAPLASGDIVEDLALTIDLAETGAAARFLSDATVWSAGGSTSATLVQRSRWEGGFLATATRRALPTIGRGIVRARPGLVWRGLHLLVPPLALLVTIDGALLGFLLLAAGLGGSAGPALALLVALLASTLLLFAAWTRHGRAYLSPTSLARIPLYIAWKLPIYARALRRGDRQWVRTPRD